MVQNIKKQFIVPGGKGFAFSVKKDQTLKITDLKGKQVVDFLSFNANNYKEYLSVTQTRTNRDQNFFIKKDDYLLSNLRNPIAQIIDDTVETHDLLIAACDPYYYEEIGLPKHHSCHQNFIDILSPYNIESWEFPDPFNIFQNTQMRSDGSWFQDTPPSNAGDYIILKMHMDVLCAISVCPFDLEGFNDGKPTPVQLNIE